MTEETKTVKKRKKRRGRPPGSKNKKRGRPPGSGKKLKGANWLDNINALGKQLEKALLDAVDRIGRI